MNQKILNKIAEAEERQKELALRGKAISLGVCPDCGNNIHWESYNTYGPCIDTRMKCRKCGFHHPEWSAKFP